MKLDVNLNMCTLFFIHERTACSLSRELYFGELEEQVKAKRKRTNNLFKVFKKACE